MDGETGSHSDSFINNFHMAL